MQYLTRWKPTLGIILTALIVCLCAVPNFFPEATVKGWPLWAQRLMVLGLDVQGGSYLLHEVDSKDVKRTRLNQVREDVQRTLRTARIQYTDLAVKGDAVEVRIRNNADQPNALTKLRDLSQPIGGLLGGTSQRDLDVTDAGGGLIRLSISEAAMTDRLRKTIEQSIQIVERRVNELGTVEPLIQRQGNDRILVQVPGLQDPTELKRILGKTAKMEFRMVDTSVPPDQARGSLPPDDELLMSTSKPPVPYVIKKQVLVSGGDLTDAQTGFDQRSGEPVVNFKFNTAGSFKFDQATTENVGQPFAIVLDNEVISAPVIREPITGGQGQISGNFTVQSANDLAILLRAGALPAPLTVIEERTVGPGLGQDSIEKGELAAYVGSIMVVVFMLLTYSLFGLFANIA